MRCFGISSSCIAMLLLAFAAQPAVAGGPFLVDTLNKSGVALRWQNDTLKWCGDEGPLSNTVDNATAIQWVNDAFNNWTTNVTIKNGQNQAVLTTVVKAEQDTGCKPGDIDASNHDPYTRGFDKQPIIIFDKDGSIIEDLMGDEAASDSIVGLSYPGTTDSSGLYMTKGGFAVFNGKMLTNGKLGTGTTAQDYFKSSIHHELGHLLNLDHSQINYDDAKNCTIGNCAIGNYIPTMYPELLSKWQASPTRDDKATISWIYPAPALKDDFCTITGEIFDKDGNPLKGVNVVAASTTDDTQAMVDARAMISGALYPECDGDSRYSLYALKPGVTYRVTYEPIGSEFTNASDFEPLGSNSPKGFQPGVVETPSGETTVKCEDGGDTIEMASVTIDTANYCAGKTGSGSGQSSTTTGTSKSKCSLVAGGAVGSASLFGLLFSALASAAVSCVRLRPSSGRK